MRTRQAIIIGAGPAGLTAAWELLDRTDIRPVVLEMSDCVGGISRTVNYRGNRIDIGGHRFFSKSDRVMEWWLDKLPLERRVSDSAAIGRPQQSRPNQPSRPGPDPETADRVMLVRDRKSRIYFLRKFFDYPVRLTADTARKLGAIRMARIAASYAWALTFGPRNPANLEQFFIRRFGRELYLTFFKSYTEKVWGESCSKISAEWGAQRIKGLSIGKALAHFGKGLLGRGRGSVRQKDTETSLIEQFLYPKYGPGQMWETVAEEVQRRGGEIIKCQHVVRLHVDGDRVTAVDALDTQTGETTTFPADYFFSTMPVQDLIEALDADVPANVREVASGLVYRDFITVGLLLKRLRVPQEDRGAALPLRDNWIYIQESDVRVGRLQIFNNWSPYLVADPRFTWVGLEYFCYQTDEIWKRTDAEMIALAGEELARIELIDPDDVVDATVIRMPKTYPAYFGTYDRFSEVRAYLDALTNLFLLGRNGMHRYNNQDHSMLTAMVAVDNLAAGRTDKANLWDVNTEAEYHEARQATAADQTGGAGRPAECPGVQGPEASLSSQPSAPGEKLAIGDSRKPHPLHSA